MHKYLYVLTDSNGKYCCSDFTRKGARWLKRNAEDTPFFVEEFGGVPPYKITRYELSNGKVVR